MSRTVAALFAAASLLVLPATAGAAGLSGSELSLLHRINRIRHAHRLQPLRYDPSLERAALSHSEDMRRRHYFAHGRYRPRLLHFHVRGAILGENIAWGSGRYGTARAIVRRWLASPRHRANLLRPGFQRIGLGEIHTTFHGIRGVNVVTADFAGR